MPGTHVALENAAALEVGDEHVVDELLGVGGVGYNLAAGVQQGVQPPVVGEQRGAAEAGRLAKPRREAVARPVRLRGEAAADVGHLVVLLRPGRLLPARQPCHRIICAELDAWASELRQ